MSKEPDEVVMKFPGMEISTLVSAIYQLTALSASTQIPSDHFREQCWKCAELIMAQLFDKLIGKQDVSP